MSAMILRIFTKKQKAAQPIEPPLSHAFSKIWFENCEIDDFELGQILGAGNFGQVFIARHIKSNIICAVKCLSKAIILNSKQLDHVKAEKEILKMIEFPFIVNLLGYCKDDKCVYLILEYVSGGEFSSYLRSRGMLDESTACFYAAQVLVAFEYLHSMNIIYRDLKPENLLLDIKGNLKITDFGFAKNIEHRMFTLCGTPEYLAPEVLLAKGHGKPVDWWTFGVLIYEMLAGVTPFVDDDASITYQRILEGKLAFPKHISKNAKDLIRKLIVGDLTKRIGCLKNGIDEIKCHPWFSNVKWDNVSRKCEVPPIKPKRLASPNDTTNFVDYSTIPPLEHPFELSAEEQDQFVNF